MIPLICSTGNKHIHKERKLKGWGRKNGELFFNGYRVSAWENEKVMEVDSGDDCTTL